ncbi:MAG: importin 11 [Lasallia pustulata]|uniref:Importin 11 n=1 Tax=Lasallia pustulata TaxID=136370 RepID=A0A5M8Q546_9LECA|nr:MAG: importin 11 [Lasallia pustulata]
MTVTELTPQLLFQVVSAAASADQQQVRNGTEQLQGLEKTGGYYSSLQTIFIDTSLPVEVRYMCAIQLKNGIDKYWRKTATNAISKEEKALIRSRCLESSTNEPDRRLALQNALVVAKIVRSEFPFDWPDAVTSVVSLLRSAAQPHANALHLPRVLLVLLYIIKELTTGRLQRTRASLQSASPEIFRVLGRIYLDKVERWRSFLWSGGDDEGGALEDVEQSLLALRVLRRLLIAGYEFPNRDKEVQEFWTLIRTQFGDLLSLAAQGKASINPYVQTLIEKHLVQMSKLHLEMARVHPAAYALLPDSTGLAFAYWDLITKFGETFGSQSATVSMKIGSNGDADEAGKPYMEKLTLKGLLLLRACIKMVFSPTQTFRYQHAEDKEERKRSTDMMKTELLTGDRACEMMEILVTRFFVFRPSDLRDWEEEPEEWERREEGEGDVWEFSVRSCAEKLFLDLMINYKSLLIQPLLNVFYSVATTRNTNVLLKDSIYAAIGLAAPVLDHELDFGAFLNSTLVSEVQVQQSGYNILRRRTAIILGQWLPVKEGLNRAMVYQIFQHLLNKDDELNDVVVRVTAGRQLKNVVDPFEFSAESFRPYATGILGALMSLIEEVDLSETKMALLNTISVIVVKMEHHISPFADQIISLLPPLWSQAGEEYLMKQSILTILAALITSMKDESRRYHSLILPLIQSSIEPDSETQVYLLEDALDLWSAILVQTPTPASPSLLSLSQYLFPIFDLATETLPKALEITESYLLLAPSEILASETRTRFLIAFTSLLGTFKREANGTITHLVEILVRAAESIGGPEAVGLLTTSLVSTGFLAKLLAGLRESFDAHQTTGPNRKHTTIDGVVETDYFSVLARIAFASPDILVQAVAASVPQAADLPSTMDWLLTEWFSHFENIGEPKRKKLMCLALTNFLSLPATQLAWVLGRLQSLMTVWTDVVTELMEGMDDQDGADCLVYWDAEGLRGERPEAPEEERRRDLLFGDPVHRVHVKDFDWVADVDRDVVAGFGALGVL